MVGRPGRVKYVGAGLGKGRQSPNRVVEIGAIVDEVVGSAGQDDSAARHLRSRADARDGRIEVVDRPGGIRGCVLDAKAGQTSTDRSLHRRLTVHGLRTEAVLEVTVYRQTAHPGKESGMRDRFLARDGMAAVLTPERKRKAEGRAC